MSLTAADFKFRRLNISDAAAMDELERKCFALPWSLEQCSKALAQPAFAAFGLWHDNCLAGYISFYHAALEMEILNFAVLPELRRRGLGRRILAIVLQTARNMGMQKAVLEVRAGNTAALALYRLFGFKQKGIRNRYYPDNGEDALVMVHDFDAKPES